LPRRCTLRRADSTVCETQSGLLENSAHWGDTVPVPEYKVTQYRDVSVCCLNDRSYHFQSFPIRSSPDSPDS
jgi:hypothetical protein